MNPILAKVYMFEARSVNFKAAIETAEAKLWQKVVDC